MLTGLTSYFKVRLMWIQLNKKIKLKKKKDINWPHILF